MNLVIQASHTILNTFIGFVYLGSLILILFSFPYGLSLILFLITNSPWVIEFSFPIPTFDMLLKFGLFLIGFTD
jgi:hypothetical protein